MFIYYGYCFIEICQFKYGFIYGGDQFKLSDPIPEKECASLVKDMKPDATGVTAYNNYGCYAEYGKQVANLVR